MVGLLFRKQGKWGGFYFTHHFNKQAFNVTWQRFQNKCLQIRLKMRSMYDIWDKTWLYLQAKFINLIPDVWETGHIKLGTTWTTIYNWSILYLPFQCWLRKIQNAALYTVVTAHRMDWDFNWKLTFISNNLRGYLGKSQSKKRFRSWILYRVNFI